MTAIWGQHCRLEPNEPVSLEHLSKLGVVYWKVNGEEDPKLQAIRDARGYSYKVRLCDSPYNGAYQPKV